MFPTGAPASVRASFWSDGNAPPQNGKTPCTLQEAFAVRDSVLHAAGSFRSSRFRPARCGKLSQFAIPSCTLQEAFAVRDSVLHAAGSFRCSRFRPARCRKLSQFAIPPCTLQEAFAVRDSALHAAGSFPAPGKAPRQTVCQKLHPFRQKIALRIGRGCLSLHRNKL